MVLEHALTDISLSPHGRLMFVMVVIFDAHYMLKINDILHHEFLLQEIKDRPINYTPNTLCQPVSSSTNILPLFFKYCSINFPYFIIETPNIWYNCVIFMV